MSDPREATTSPDGGPPAPRRGRVVLIVLSCVAIAALVSVLVVALRGSDRSSDAAQRAGAPITLDPAQRLDTEAAVRNGATHLRIGTALLGRRRQVFS